MRLHRFKSRQRVTIRLALALVVVLTLGSWLTAEAVERELLGDIDERLRAEAVEITEAADVIEGLDGDLIEAVAAQLELAGRDWSVMLRRPDGTEVVIGAGSPRSASPAPDVVDTPLAELRGRAGEPFTVGDVDGGGDTFRVLTTALDDGSVVIVARSRSSVQAALDILHKLFVIGLVLSVLALALLVWLISKHALKPLEDVVETAQAIGEGNLTSRVEVSSTAPDVERLADAMNTMLGRLQTAFANKERSEARLRQFVSDASHELRTPLAAILGYAELYDERMARSPEQVDAAMRHITVEATRMQSLVEDLLLLARLDEGRPLARDAVDLTATVGEAVAAIRAVDGEHSFVVGGDEPVEVVGDGLALRQVVDNLLTNVVCHTPPGTTAEVIVGRETSNADGVERDWATVTVRDDGPGMDTDHVAKVFDRFFRVEEARTRPGGSGLGLAIVDEIVRAHGGSITLQTAPGEGSTFVIRLADPRDVAAAEELATSAGA